ncbi:glycosyltransferase [Actinocorallia populi]|uniref:glycosyltransferase n=1 Tax=Actinocorallia populi TaxID=2079200 RepID=UPI000D088DAA|nr:glycosyltransferase [Actinocorallia populi]
MRFLLSTIGTRGDVQPLVALAMELRGLGQEVHLCVPPDFRDWIDGFAIPATAIGPELRKAAAVPSAPSAPPSPERLRLLARDSVAAQFATVAEAAEGCDVIVAATALQVAARSVAELKGIPYVFAAYCPAVLPSPHHAPPVLPGPPPAETGDRGPWDRDAARFNEMFGDALDSHRASLGLAPVEDVRGHILTERPLLAADPVLAPWPGPADAGVVQTGAWILRDRRPLPPELVEFLRSGEPPVYFGLGSRMHAPQGLVREMVESARTLGRRAIVSRGWAGLSPVDDAPDCMSVGDVDHRALFGRVAAVVHHGGAGTTTTAALAGTPQVVLPQVYDQYYWAQRVQDLGIGTAHPSAEPTAESLAAALDRALRPGTAARARAVAAEMSDDGAGAAARHLVSSNLQSPP